MYERWRFQAPPAHPPWYGPRRFQASPQPMVWSRGFTVLNNEKPTETKGFHTRGFKNLRNMFVFSLGASNT